ESISVFHERVTPEEGHIVGYAALMNYYELQIPVPDVLSIISHKHKQYQADEWRVFTPRHIPEDTLIGHVTFALKYEGIELGLLKQLFHVVATEEWAHIISQEPTGQYRRRIWFLYEWLMDDMLDLPDMTVGNYIDLIDTNLQFGKNPPVNS